MQEQLIVAIIAGLGAVSRGLWSYLKKKAKNPKLKFDLLKIFITLAPAFVAGFVAGYSLRLSYPIDFLAVFFAGAGFSSFQDKIGLQVK